MRSAALPPASARLSGATLLLLSLLVALPCLHAWGDVGHTITGRIAMSHFYGATQSFVSSLVPEVGGDISQVSVASWPDTIRCATCPYPYTDAYHTVNLPTFQCHYNPVDCGANGCADAAIQNYTSQLADANDHRTLRNESLKYVVHFIGDIHQPLHAGNARDRNGNSIPGLWFGGIVYPEFETNRTNLHAVWDTGIIQSRINRDFAGSAESYIQYLVRQVNTTYAYQLPQWRSCGVDTPTAQTSNYNACSYHWIQESAALACGAAYLNPDGSVMDWQAAFNLSDAYYHANLRVVETRLMQAGVRMAHVLNLIANGMPPAPPSGGGEEEKEGYSGAVVGFLVVLFVVTLMALIAAVVLYQRKERLGLSGLFDKAESGSGGGGGARMSSDSNGLRSSLL